MRLLDGLVRYRFGGNAEPSLSPVDIQHVIVNGVSVVANGRAVEGVAPGKAVRAVAPR